MAFWGSTSRSVCTRCLRRSLQSPASRYLQSSQLFSTSARSAVIAPPSPASLGKATPAKQYKKTRKWLRRLIYLGAFTGVAWTVDNQLYASSLMRTTRTFANGLFVACDYKINFRENPPFAHDIAEVHERSARRLFELLRTNGGLYLKIGQAIAMQSAILPPEFQKMFARMFDDAPQNSWEDVRKVVMADFDGKTPEEVFGISFEPNSDAGVMEKKARASASVAQVHWARLKDGREVAIKIQKREIAQQVDWDLWGFKVVARIYSYWFDLPFYNLVPYITERLKLECDFQNEAENSERMAGFVGREPRLKDRVYVPKVYHELSSKRVMTAEWIEGVRLWDKDGITKSWQGGWKSGSPGADGKPLPFQDFYRPTNARDYHDHLKPNRDSWKGRDGKGGLGLNLKEVMTTMVDLFSAQMFLWGYVHCDPHPGNIFIRRKSNGHSELVLIDHGLYINMSPKFRHQYSRFWKSLMTFDNATLNDVVQQWGVKNPEFFAGATLLKPYEGGEGSVQKRFQEIAKEKDKQKRQYEMQQAFRKGLRDMLADETKWPRELIFIGRNMRIVQGNNQYLGSPVNRIKITGQWASKALTEDPNLSIGERLKYYGSHLLFKTVLFTTDLYFYYAKIKQFFGRGKGMDDDIENQVRKMASDYGVEMQHGVFEG